MVIDPSLEQTLFTTLVVGIQSKLLKIKSNRNLRFLDMWKNGHLI